MLCIIEFDSILYIISIISFLLHWTKMIARNQAITTNEKIKIEKKRKEMKEGEETLTHLATNTFHACPHDHALKNKLFRFERATTHFVNKF